MFFKRKASEPPPSTEENEASSSQASTDSTKQSPSSDEQTQPLPYELRMRRLALLQQRLGTIKKMEEDAAKRRADVKKEFERIEKMQRETRSFLESVLAKGREERGEKFGVEGEGKGKGKEKEGEWEVEEERGRTRKRRDE
jgi:hypothetical protein